MGRVYKSLCCMVKCDTHNSDISITEQIIYYEDVIQDEYTYMFIQ